MREGLELQRLGMTAHGAASLPHAAATLTASAGSTAAGTAGTVATTAAVAASVGRAAPHPYHHSHPWLPGLRGWPMGRLPCASARPRARTASCRDRSPQRPRRCRWTARSASGRHAPRCSAHPRPADHPRRGPCRARGLSARVGLPHQDGARPGCLSATAQLSAKMSDIGFDSSTQFIFP